MVFFAWFFPLHNCRDQAYDGAANFLGHISGVAVLIQDQEPRAFSVLCLVHCLNLSLQHTAWQVTAMRDPLDFAAELIQIVAISPTRQVLFEQFQQERGKPLPGLRPLCPTRLTVRTRAFVSTQLHSLAGDTKRGGNRIGWVFREGFGNLDPRAEDHHLLWPQHCQARVWSDWTAVH